MPRRGENIRKRKDGRWEARYKVGINTSGKTQYRSVYGKTYREVKEKQKEILRLTNPPKLNLNPKTLIFRDAAKLWLENNRVRIKGATENKYQNLLDSHILPDIGNIRLTEIDGLFINKYLASKLDHGRLDGNGGLSPSYVRSIMLLIRSIMTFAATNLMCFPLLAPISKPVVASTEISVLSSEEQKVLETACMSQIDTTKIGILMSLYTGLRIGEICALEWSDIDFQNQIIHVRKTVSRVINSDIKESRHSKLIIDRPKTQFSNRAIPLCSWLVPILAEYRQNSQSPYVVSDNSDFLSPRTYDYRYHKVLATAGIRSFNYHTLRHTFATRCIEAGVDVKSLSEMLGHADASITLNTYVHSSMERKRIQLEKLRE